MGNYEPRRFKVSVMGDGFYIARADNGTPIHVYAPPKDEDLDEWSLGLDDTQLEAALQIYFDRWTFQSGEQCDRDALDALHRERARRQLPGSTWAPGIFAKLVAE